MADPRFGSGSVFKNYWLRNEARGEADISDERLRLERNVTAIEETILTREVQKHLAVNQVNVLDLATAAGVDVPTFCTMVLEESRAVNADLSAYCTKVCEWWFAEQENHRTLGAERERSGQKVFEQGQMDGLLAAKEERKGITDARIAGETTRQTIEASDDYILSPYERLAKLHKIAGDLRQQIEDTLVMPGKSIEWRRDQAAMLSESLVDLQKKIREL